MRRVRRDDEVYPRVCGGTEKATIPTIEITGLSPRVRGNPQGLVVLGDC